MLSPLLSLLLGLLLFSPCLLLLASSPLPTSTWVYFEIRETLQCDSLPLYLHGIVTDRCFPTDEPFFSLWDGENTSKDARSFRVTVSLSPPVNNASLDPSLLPYAQDFVLETFSGAECGAESLLSRALLPYAQPSVEPGNLNLTSQSGSGSDGDGDGNNWRWSINGCSRSPWNAQQSMILRASTGMSPPTIISHASPFTDMTLVNSSATKETCKDLVLPTNFSVWRSRQCISLDGKSSVMFSCPPMGFVGTPKPPSQTLFAHSSNCSGEGTDRSLYSQCEVLPPTYGGSLLTIRRETCGGSLPGNFWFPEPEEDKSPHAHNRSQPLVRVVVSFAISPLHETALNNLRFPTRDGRLESALQSLVCGTLTLPVEHCALHSLSVQQKSPQNAPQHASYRYLRASLSDADSSLALLATVNVTLFRNNLPLVTGNTTTAYNVTAQTQRLGDMSHSLAWNNFFQEALAARPSFFLPSSSLIRVETEVYSLSTAPHSSQPPTPPNSLPRPPDLLTPNSTEPVVSSDNDKKRLGLSPSAFTGLMVSLALLGLLQVVLACFACCPNSIYEQVCFIKSRASVLPLPSDWPVD